MDSALGMFAVSGAVLAVALVTGPLDRPAPRSQPGNETARSTPAHASRGSYCEDLVEAAIEVVADRHGEAFVRESVGTLRGSADEACAAEPDPPAALRLVLAPVDDPAIRLLAADHFQRMLAEWQGRPVPGVGLTEVLSIDVDEETHRLTVITPVPDSPAEAAGLRAGDVVTRIDGVDTDTLGLSRSMKRLRIPAGESVRLEVLRDDRPREVVLAARALPALEPMTTERIREGERDVLVLRLRQFTPGVGDRIREQVHSAPDVDAILLDLRENPGGLVDELVAVARVFLEPGSVVARLAGPEPVTLRIEGEGSPTNVPVAAIVGTGSASAAEALAAALQANGRATVYGEPTYGKGLAHDAVPLAEGAWILMLPVGHLETPDGRTVLGTGIDPDIRTSNPYTQALRGL
ncbi:MAG: S41 family peptidase [Gemmatimonadota bacterium]|nr:S41 family peptidase [Gemmatimonadota bacterium]